MVRCRLYDGVLKQPLQDQVNDGPQEYKYGELIYAVHHLQAEVLRAVRIISAEKISADLAEFEEIFPGVLLLFGCMRVLFHELIVKFRHDCGSIQSPCSRMSSINSSTACTVGTFLRTTSFPLYNVILPGPDPT